MRPTFVHELAGFIDWYQKNKIGGNRPVKVALVTSEASPTYADIAKGIRAYAKANPKVISLVEVVFAYPGIGSVLYTAIKDFDYFLIQGIVFTVVVSIAFATLVVDLVHPLIDPRITYRRA